MKAFKWVLSFCLPFIFSLPVWAIIGGFPIRSSDHPLNRGLAQVMLFDETGDRAICSGVLISPTQVLTANHCAGRGSFSFRITIRYWGKQPVNSGRNIVAQYGVVSDVRIARPEQVVSLAQFKDTRLGENITTEKNAVGIINDLAIISVDEPFSKEIRPVQLASDEIYPHLQGSVESWEGRGKFYAAGYGFSKDYPAPFNQLNILSGGIHDRKYLPVQLLFPDRYVPIHKKISENYIMKVYGRPSTQPADKPDDLYNAVGNRVIYFTGNPFGLGTVSNGDSGGPVFWEDKDHEIYLAGILSKGIVRGMAGREEENFGIAVNLTSPEAKAFIESNLRR